MRTDSSRKPATVPTVVSAALPAVLISVALFLGACRSDSIPIAIYTLRPVVEVIPVEQPVPFTARVMPFSSREFVDRPNFVMLDPLGEVEADPHNLWAEEPPNLVAYALEDALRTSNLFEGVLGPESSRGHAAIRVAGRLTQFNGVRGADGISAVVGLEVVLQCDLDVPEETFHAFAVTPLEGTDVAAFLEALTTSLELVVAQQVEFTTTWVRAAAEAMRAARDGANRAP